jgi:putative serine protease PepD
MSEMSGQGRATDPGRASGGRSVTHSASVVGAQDGAANPGPNQGHQSPSGVSDFGQFGWFAEPDSPPGQAGRRPGSRRLSRRSRLLIAIVVALACTVLGGVIGGFVALQHFKTTADPSYNLGTVPPAAPDRPASSIARIAARDTPGVVMIKVNGGEGTGSGFIIQGGYIVTDNHVVTLDGLAHDAPLEIYFSNGKSARGQLVGGDPYSDIAVLKAPAVTNLPALPLGNSASVDVGDPVVAIGSPLGLADTVTSGIVSAVNRPVQPGVPGDGTPKVFFDAIQTDAPINPGNSGGPLVNSRGQVIGVDAAIDTLVDNPMTGSQGGSIGLGFAIPINQARRVAVELIRTGHATHAVLGATLNMDYAGTGAQIRPVRRDSAGAIDPGGPAAIAGLRPGDVIVRFGSQLISNPDSLVDAVRSYPPGTRVSLTVRRRGQMFRTSVTLGSAES